MEGILYQVLIGMRPNFWIIVCLTLSASIFAQKTATDIQVSLLTCTPGYALYSTFGHSAIRVTHKHTNEDIVFDFGVFDFDEPFFIWKFLQGDLQYHVASRSFEDFATAYQLEGRGVIEQRLNLSSNEKRSLHMELVKNCRPENRHYHYEFLSNNCSTRIRDLIAKWASDSLPKKNEELDQTFRSCLHSYLKSRPWIKFGVDLLLGSPTDRKINFAEQMFLPNQLSANLAEMYYGNSNKKLSEPPMILLEGNTALKSMQAYLTPFFCFLLLGLIWLVAGIWKPIPFSQTLRWLRILLGLGGLFLVFMWIGTSHPTTKMNYNLLWLNPLYLFLVFSKDAKVKAFTLVILLMINILLLSTWNVLPQQLNMGSIPIVICMIMANLMEFARGQPQQD